MALPALGPVRTALLARGIAVWLAVIQIALLIIVAANHWRFPLYLETMEGAVLEHVRRAAMLLPVYPAPSPEHVALAYNPLFYELAAPFTQVFGLDVATLRLVAILGFALSGVLVFVIVREALSNRWMALVATGLFAGAYKVMDAYLDTAHSDSWLLASILLGGTLIGRSRSMAATLGGMAMLCAAFWFKQQGVVFAAAALAFVWWRDGLVRALPAVGVTALLGPVLYIFAGPALFGSHFHVFTWEVPASWSVFSPKALLRYAGFLVMTYPLLLAASLLWLADAVGQNGRTITVWHALLLAGLAGGALAVLSPGSASNVFAPIGTLLIICGTIAIGQALPDFDDPARGTPMLLAASALLLSFLPLLYDPRPLLVSPNAAQAFRDFRTYVASLDAPVYSPSLGALPSRPGDRPAVVWVALDDLVRGQKGRVEAQARRRAMFDAALLPALGEERRLLLMNEPLEGNAVFEHLRPHYVLLMDLERRFAPLAGLPGAYPVRSSWPRYLYQRRTSAAP